MNMLFPSQFVNVRYTKHIYITAGERGFMSIGKLIVVLMLIAIIASLGVALAQMIRDKGQIDRTVKALTVRVILSIALFIFLMVAFATGLLTPHSIY